jgi:hypothetical protein
VAADTVYVLSGRFVPEGRVRLRGTEPGASTAAGAAAGGAAQDAGGVVAKLRQLRGLLQRSGYAGCEREIADVAAELASTLDCVRGRQD